MKRFFSPLAGLLVSALLLSACNVMEGLYEEGAASEPEFLLEDAEAALTRGESDKAVSYLEKARAMTAPGTSEHQRVLVLLSSATLQQHGLRVTTLHRMATDLVDEIEAQAGVSGAGKSSSDACSFDEADGFVRGDEVTLETIDGFEELQVNAAALDSVKTWIAEAIAFEDEHPGSTFDIDEAVSRLRAKDYTDEEIAGILLNLSIAYFGASYNDLVEAGAEQITWYAVTAPDGETFLGYCAPTQDVIDGVVQRTACIKGDLRFGVDLLHARAALLGEGTVAEVVAEKAEEGFAKLEENLEETCAMDS